MWPDNIQSSTFSVLRSPMSLYSLLFASLCFSLTDIFGADPIPISWGHPDPRVRGPVICTVRHSSQRNAIGAHQGSYCIYTGLAVAANQLDPNYVPNLSLTSPVFKIGPHPSWADPKKIGGLDPFGHMVTECYGDWLEKGWDIRPTIAVTKAHIDLPGTYQFTI